ncbi:hypothetical protein TH61_04610 [Rufibacter sp. DG15C]|uniref:hypothetical protein n=1 Tax=Rufibacter sp. DG15C TaxID=1379909 RepID=UPI00078B565D|nr:hypothetical protein [Rufibacter sp. DG15C]AMM50600.1 hypothetical protein TH61_04610 [Rufibacter sp. DG15C]
MTVTYTSPSATISQDLDQKILHLQWTGVVASAVFRETLERALQLINSSQLLYCVYNIQDLRPMPLQDYDWVAYEFIPKVLQSSLKKVAVLESDQNAEQLSLQHMVYASYTSLNFKLKYVDDIAAALKWFAKKKHAPEEAIAMADAYSL